MKHILLLLDKIFCVLYSIFLISKYEGFFIFKTINCIKDNIYFHINFEFDNISVGPNIFLIMYLKFSGILLSRLNSNVVLQILYILFITDSVNELFISKSVLYFISKYFLNFKTVLHISFNLESVHSLNIISL